ncbi:hypothetical protein FKG94_27680 [Exilibacterium tricleocarpae]|uniref:Phthalyl amidase n=1 Tax=Exilibacterium tricleocarpae TaxID=2591008 RepID=A0A545SLW7_9GAMM|nr:hypothetical protein [Exilibacterium tricleocarpae]TQV65977.1 hypothetical protein FKG94_27680 [Exilibacterium tricleocarpae]
MTTLSRQPLLAIITIAWLGISSLSVNADHNWRASRDIPPYFVDTTKLPFTALPDLPARQLWGVIRGAGYRIEVPDAWNGDLVMWAHGFRGDGLELTVDNHPLRAWLLANGFAWAASSFSRNNYEVGQAALDSHRLRLAFRRLVAKPHRVYMSGASMGGHITGVVIERWPWRYNGALSICGVMGDLDLFDYFFDFSLVAQSLADIEAEFPPPADYATAVIPEIRAQLELFPDSFPFTLNQAGESLKQATRFLTGGARPTFDQGFIFWNGVNRDFVLGLADGDGTPEDSRRVVVDTTDSIYQLDGDPSLSPEEQRLNDSVLRIEDEGRKKYQRGLRLRSIPKIRGNIRMPVLSLHTLGDLFVPFHMQQIYARRVARYGRSHLLVQRAIRDFGHCTFTPEELSRGMSDLVDWVEHGSRPAGDNILDPQIVADPDFGCRFTEGSHDYDFPLTIPACSGGQ